MFDQKNRQPLHGRDPFTCFPKTSSFIFMTRSKRRQKRGYRDSIKNYCFGFLVISTENNHSSLFCAPLVFCPVCERLSSFIRADTSELWQPSFCSQSQLVIRIWLLTAHTANMLECMGNIACWNVTGNSCQPTKEQESSHKASQELQTNHTAFSITHQWPSLAFDEGSCAVRESKCSIASNAHPCLGWNLAISGSSIWCAHGVEDI